MAAEFLHHVAYVNLDEISYKERVERYDVMGDLYQQLNFHRKASFFKRVAAMHCVNPMLPSPAWSECYHLLLQAFPGFKMSFDPKHYQTPGQTMGWPGIRLRVFHELLFAARQLGNNLVVIRHVALCLHTMFGCMIAKEIVDLVHLLETYTDLQYDDGADVTTLHNIDLPPVPFTAFPLLSSFSVMKLPTQLEAHKVKLNVPNDSVFIYSPMNLPRKDSTTQLITQYDFYWVQDNPGTVEVHLYNPLPLELNITDFSLLVEGARFQSYPSSHALPPESGPHIINIVGTPSQRGKLKILGYQMSLFGVLSRCLFTELPHLKQNTYIVDIAPVLPSISISSELPKSPYMVTGGDNKIVTSAILQIYVGEERECSIRLKNNSNISVVRIHAELFSDKYQDLVSRFLSVDSGDIESCLPLVPGEETTLKIRTNGALKLTDLPNQALLSPGNNTDTDSNRASSALIESLLKVTYTGAQGDMDKFYRECIMSIDVVVIPSVNILSQSITPVGAESCHVVYEVFNESNMILEIESSDKTISLKPMQSDSSSMDEGLHCKLDKSSSSSSLEECMLTINESVSMSWRSNDKTHHGLVNIDKLEWSDTELDKLRKRPFTVTGSVTKNSCSRFMVGEPIELSYQITNTSGLDYSDIELRFAVYQESASNQTGIEEGLTYIQPGASHYSYPQFDLSELIDLRHSIVMLFAGQYTIECFCYHQGKQIFDIDPGITLMVV